MILLRKKGWQLLLVQLVTISRALTAFVFVSIALIPEYRTISSILFIYACLSDILDGFLARFFSCSSQGGKALDLFSDKYLTILCILYAVARGQPIIPCSIVIFREVFLLAIRTLHQNGTPIIPTQRVLGGITVLPIWGITLLLLQYQDISKLLLYYLNMFYWSIGAITLINLVQKIWKNWDRLLLAFKT